MIDSRMTKTDTANSYQERILRVLVHIQERLDEPLALDTLAGEVLI